MRSTIEMAREAGFDTHTSEVAMNVFFTEELKRFETLVRADEREQGQKWFDAVTAQHRVMILAEREACAKVCDEARAARLAEQIRARGETK
jgi:hypothetical protein